MTAPRLFTNDMASSSYPEKLAAWVTDHKPKRSPDTNLVAFLAAKDDVQAAMELGYSSATIYAHLKQTGRIQCSYETFRRYVRRLIQGQPSGTSTRKAKKDSKTGIAGFAFNARPNKEDLI